MSSTYRPICLNHNPALTIDREITRDAVEGFNNRDGLDGHADCDLVIGRYSYPLVEVACLGRQLPGPTGCKGYHTRIEWTDKQWLRLLLAAAPSIDPKLLQPLVSGCWPLDRLERLRAELDLPAPPVVDGAADARAVVGSVELANLHAAIRSLAQRDPAWWRMELDRMARMEARTSFLGRRR